MIPGRGERIPGTRPFVLAVSGSDIRKFVGIPEEGFPPGTAWARPAGRRLAIHPMLANPRPDGLDVVLDVLEQARSLLVAVGVRFDVIRIRRGCAVVRALPLEGMSAGAACELSRGLLETVPAMARGIRGTVVETTCRERGAEACLYTMLWDATMGVMTLYRPFARHGPWAAQTGVGAAFVLDPDLTPPWSAPPGRSFSAEQPPHAPPSDREPDSRGGT